MASPWLAGFSGAGPPPGPDNVKDLAVGSCEDADWGGCEGAYRGELSRKGESFGGKRASQGVADRALQVVPFTIAVLQCLAREGKRRASMVLQKAGFRRRSDGLG
jgi:hypothetical protein